MYVTQVFYKSREIFQQLSWFNERDENSDAIEVLNL